MVVLPLGDEIDVPSQGKGDAMREARAKNAKMRT